MKMSKIGVVSAILEHPKEVQDEFNDVVASFRGSIKGRMGIPFADELSVISIALTGESEETINDFTEQLDRIDGVSVKTSIAKIEV
jgi:putative iron-only hydrogenase system regulator